MGERKLCLHLSSKQEAQPINLHLLIKSKRQGSLLLRLSKTCGIWNLITTNGCVFPAVNQRDGSLWKQIKWVQRGQRVTFFAVIGEFRSVLKASVFQVRWHEVKRSRSSLWLVDFDPFCYFCRFPFFTVRWLPTYKYLNCDWRQRKRNCWWS